MKDSILNLSGLRRLPLIRQTEATECGLACLGMVASYFGQHRDLSELRRDFPVSLRGMTLHDLIEVGAQLELGARPLRCELEELPELRAPAILHWDLSHFVVLKSASRHRLIIHDPGRGVVQLRTEEAGDRFTGVALELSPTARFQKKRERVPVRLSSFLRFEPSTWAAMCQALVLSLLLQVFVLAAPFFLQLVIDEAVVKMDAPFLAAIAAGFALLKVFEVVATIIRSLVFQFISNVLTFDMRASLFHHMTRLPLPYFHRRHVGDIQQRFMAISAVSDLVVNGAIASLIDGVLAITVAALLFMYNAGLAWIVVGGLFIYALARFAFLALSKRLAGDLLDAQAKESSKFLETLRAIQAIKLAGAESAREVSWRNLSANAANAVIRVGNVNIVYQSISQAILGLSTIGVVYVAASAAIDGKMTIGIITAFLAYKSQLEQRITALIEQYINLRMLDVQLERVADIALHAREPNIDQPLLDRSMLGKIDLAGVRFRYAPHEPDVLKGVTLSVAAGEFVAITGPSGCGKSTLLRVLTGLYPPTIGNVLLDGVPISTWGPRSVRTQIGVVMQDDTLLAGTIAENIAMFDEHIDMDRVRDVAVLACVDKDIELMPMGYRSYVGDMGSSLSGGQQQRVMLARALYRSPRILLMDEGTAHLDAETERRVNENLKSLAITRIVIAHRAETIAAADRRLTLSDGVITDPGGPGGVIDIRALAGLVSNMKSGPSQA